MKGIIFGGGTGSRLAPLTQSDNKHLLPVFKRRMIEYPILTLIGMGIQDIVLVTGGNRPGTFLEHLKTGKDLGINRLYYTYQEGNGGTGEALRLAKPFFSSGEKCVCIHGDNYFDTPPVDALNTWKDGGYKAHILLQQTKTPWHFGIADIEENRVRAIQEKPSTPLTDYAILGCFMFDTSVWSILDSLPCNLKEEFTIEKVLEVYLANKNLGFSFYRDYWSDMGTFESWMAVSKHIQSKSTTLL